MTDADTTSDRPNHVKRQIGPWGQLAIHGVFGVLVPVALLVFGSPIFTGGPVGIASGGFLDLRVMVVLISVIAIGSLLLWITTPVLRERLADIATPIFLISGCLSICCGVLVVVASLFGIVYMISVAVVQKQLVMILMAIVVVCLALTPFGTGYVYLQYARNAYRLSGWSHVKGTWQRAAAHGAAGVLLIMVVPVSVQWQLNSYVETNVQAVISGSSSDASAAMARLKMAVWCTPACYRGIARALLNTKPGLEYDRLTAAFVELVGREPYVVYDVGVGGP